MKRWFVLTLQVPEEWEEAVSNFLIEKGTTGIEEIDEDPKSKKLKAYFSQDEKGKRVLRDLHRYLNSLKKVFPERSGFRIETTSILEQDWGENWKRFFKPVHVTGRVVVKPPWSRLRPKKGQIVIDIQPGMAFGTGTHASTKLSIRALEAGLRKKRLSVLDVGTGSGILSIAAARLGAREVWGLDVDRVAVENAKENVGLNDVSCIVRIRKGSVGKIQKKFDVVVANIDYQHLRRMRMSLLRHLKSGGLLILSGILEQDAERLRQYYMEIGLFKRSRMTQEGEWICFIFRGK